MEQAAVTYKYTQVMFATPKARIKYLEALVEVQARKIVSLANEHSLQETGGALVDLEEQLQWLDEARAERDAHRT